MKITLIGSGNVAYHLSNSLHLAGHRIIEVFGRNPETTSKLAQSVGAISNNDPNKINPESDFYLFAVPDDVIAQIAGQVAKFIPGNAIVAHTSGIHDFGVFPDHFRRAGVFYPLQTFTAGIPVDIAEVPILLHASGKGCLEVLESIAGGISNRVVTGITKAQKEQLHVAAVFVNNFSNHLFEIARQMCATQQIPFDLLKPLMRQTVRKLDYLPPGQAQTGPAVRNDRQTLDKHRTLLVDHPRWKEIYELFTASIAEK